MIYSEPYRGRLCMREVLNALPPQSFSSWYHYVHDDIYLTVVTAVILNIFVCCLFFENTTRVPIMPSVEPAHADVAAAVR